MSYCALDCRAGKLLTFPFSSFEKRNLNFFAQFREKKDRSEFPLLSLEKRKRNMNLEKEKSEFFAQFREEKDKSEFPLPSLEKRKRNMNLEKEKSEFFERRKTNLNSLCPV